MARLRRADHTTLETTQALFKLAFSRSDEDGDGLVESCVTWFVLEVRVVSGMGVGLSGSIGSCDWRGLEGRRARRAGTVLTDRNHS